MILIQIGMQLLVVKWIMACVTSAQFEVLVNGVPSIFFKSERGIRQGCPLSPLLFLLVIEGLSTNIQDGKTKGMIKGIKLCKNLSITYFLFADDVLLFGLYSLEEWRCYKGIINIFCKASGMTITCKKSILVHSNMDSTSLSILTSILPYKSFDLQIWFNYLEYNLKPTDYRIQYWHWVLKKFESRIKNWTFRLLSISGRLTLIKVVLTSIHVY